MPEQPTGIPGTGEGPSGLRDRPFTFGWIMQPALFGTPPGADATDMRLARDIVAANERHLEFARSAGFDTVWVEDHMCWGDRAHLECFTSMSWLAGRHPGLRYGTMVCGQGFRNPAYLAKLATNMYLLTGGRFVLGIGAGNNAAEHRQYGFAFPPPGTRLAQTEESIKVMRALWTQSPATFEGRYYSVHDAFCSPLPDGHIPLMIGGGGERKMLALVARHADWWCADIAPPRVFAHKSELLARHCSTLGRDPGEILRSQVAWIALGADAAQGAALTGCHVVGGSAEDVVRELQAFRDAGARHFQLRFVDYPSLRGMERFVSEVMPRLA